MFRVTFDWETGKIAVLSASEIGAHDDGWTISGYTDENVGFHVDEFTAEHPDLGHVTGSFNYVVRATSFTAFEHFIKYHQPLIVDSDALTPYIVQIANPERIVTSGTVTLKLKDKFGIEGFTVVGSIYGHEIYQLIR